MIAFGRVARPLDWVHWPAAKAMLDPALALSDEAWPEVEAELAADTMQLVAVLDGDEIIAAVVTRTAATARGDMLELYLCGGRHLEKWADQLATALIDSARAAGMIGTRVIGRFGWQRVLAGAGFRPKAIVLEAA